MFKCRTAWRLNWRHVIYQRHERTIAARNAPRRPVGSGLRHAYGGKHRVGASTRRYRPLIGETRRNSWVRVIDRTAPTTMSQPASVPFVDAAKNGNAIGSRRWERSRKSRQFVQHWYNETAATTMENLLCLAGMVFVWSWRTATCAYPGRVRGAVM